MRHAQALLERGESVTDAIFASGFNTRSNSNREVLRVVGTSPSEWMKGSGNMADRKLGKIEGEPRRDIP
ncbi:MAG: hypothetical protein JJU24_01630 [Natronohydrobacter sp.]|nr:hypothetical protein [Natronohydrobacter sp.]